MEQIQLKTVRDSRGSLTVAQGFPFEVKRIYFLHDCSGSRGGHAQKTVDRLMFVPAGCFVVHMRGVRGWSQHRMDDPSVALRIPPMTWLELSDFSNGAVCLIAASAEYDEADSIRDFTQFKRALL